MRSKEGEPRPPRAKNTSQAFTSLQHSILAPEDSWKRHTRTWELCTAALQLPKDALTQAWPPPGPAPGVSPGIPRSPLFSPGAGAEHSLSPRFPKDMLHGRGIISQRLLPSHFPGGQPQLDALCRKCHHQGSASQGTECIPRDRALPASAPRTCGALRARSPNLISVPSGPPVHPLCGTPEAEPAPPPAAPAAHRSVPSRQRRRQIVSVLRMRRKVVHTRARLGRSVPGSEPKICTSSSGGNSNKDSGARAAGQATTEGGSGRPPSMRSAASSSSVTPPPPASSGSVSVSGSLSAVPQRCSLAAPRRRQPRAGPTPHNRAHTAMAAAALPPRRAALPAAARGRRWSRPP